ncbi:CBS domain-containing protein [Pseudokordiimonas caeni]|uniref:CBS domain-containing protein n=1 Tax=Pseudokordiimonas caeni TaxID=2997908 RepID=UPI002810C803|nr:CBS domain-containing protein [Pseudokordiimonas caeni]
MKTAQDVMRPANRVIQIDQPITEAHARFKNWNCDHLIVVDGDRFKGVLHRSLAFSAQEGQTEPAETVGDLKSLLLRICPLDANISDLRHIFERFAVSLILIVDDERQVCGYVTPEDVHMVHPVGGRAHLPTASVMGTSLPRDNREPYTMNPHLEL